MKVGKIWKIPFIQMLKGRDKDTMSFESLSSGPLKVTTPEQVVAMTRCLIIPE